MTSVTGVAAADQHGNGIDVCGLRRRGVASAGTFFAAALVVTAARVTSPKAALREAC